MSRGGAPLVLERAGRVGLSFAKTETYCMLKASCAMCKKKRFQIVSIKIKFFVTRIVKLISTIKSHNKLIQRKLSSYVFIVGAMYNILTVLQGKTSELLSIVAWLCCIVL